MSTEREKSLDIALGQIERQFGKGSVMRLGEAADRLAVEFRNRYWLSDRNRERTFQFLRGNNLAFIAVDEPQGFKSSVPPVAEVTVETAIVRFHGRNKETWEKKGLSASSERFNYCYSPEEMQERASEVHLVVNTNYLDQGIVNSRLLGILLGEGLRSSEQLA